MFRNGSHISDWGIQYKCLPLSFSLFLSYLSYSYLHWKGRNAKSCYNNSSNIGTNIVTFSQSLTNTIRFDLPCYNYHSTNRRPSAPLLLRFTRQPYFHCSQQWFAPFTTMVPISFTVWHHENHCKIARFTVQNSEFSLQRSPKITVSYSDSSNVSNHDFTCDSFPQCPGHECFCNPECSPLTFMPDTTNP